VSKNSNGMKQVFLRHFVDPIRVLEFQIGSLESEKIIIGSQNHRKSGP